MTPRPVHGPRKVRKDIVRRFSTRPLEWGAGFVVHQYTLAGETASSGWWWIAECHSLRILWNGETQCPINVLYVQNYKHRHDIVLLQIETNVWLTLCKLTAQPSSQCAAIAPNTRDQMVEMIVFFSVLRNHKDTNADNFLIIYLARDDTELNCNKLSLWNTKTTIFLQQWMRVVAFLLTFSFIRF